MFAEEYLQMEIKTIKKQREKKLQAAKAEKSLRSGTRLELILFNCVKMLSNAVINV